MKKEEARGEGVMGKDQKKAQWKRISVPNVPCERAVLLTGNQTETNPLSPSSTSSTSSSFHTFPFSASHVPDHPLNSQTDSTWSQTDQAVVPKLAASRVHPPHSPTSTTPVSALSFFPPPPDDLPPAPPAPSDAEKTLMSPRVSEEAERKESEREREKVKAIENTKKQTTMKRVVLSAGETEQDDSANRNQPTGGQRTPSRILEIIIPVFGLQITMEVSGRSLVSQIIRRVLSLRPPSVLLPPDAQLLLTLRHGPQNTLVTRLEPERPLSDFPLASTQTLWMHYQYIDLSILVDISPSENLPTSSSSSSSSSPDPVVSSNPLTPRQNPASQEKNEEKDTTQNDIPPLFSSPPPSNPAPLSPREMSSSAPPTAASVLTTAPRTAEQEEEEKEETTQQEIGMRVDAYAFVRDVVRRVWRTSIYSGCLSNYGLFVVSERGVMTLMEEDRRLLFYRLPEGISLRFCSKAGLQPANLLRKVVANSEDVLVAIKCPAVGVDSRTLRLPGRSSLSEVLNRFHERHPLVPTPLDFYFVLGASTGPGHHPVEALTLSTSLESLRLKVPPSLPSLPLLLLRRENLTSQRLQHQSNNNSTTTNNNSTSSKGAIKKKGERPSKETEEKPGGSKSSVAFPMEAACDVEMDCEGFRVPALLSRMKQWLFNEGKGLEQEGLFRMAGRDTSIRDLIKEFQAGITTPQRSTVGWETHEIATLIKRYFMALPTRLLGSLTETQLRMYAEDPSPSPSLESQMSPLILDHWKWLIHMLSQVSLSYASTRMDATNLGLVFGPCATCESWSRASPLAELMVVRYSSVIISRYVSAYNLSLTASPPVSTPSSLEEKSPIDLEECSPASLKQFESQISSGDHPDSSVSSSSSSNTPSFVSSPSSSSSETPAKVQTEEQRAESPIKFFHPPPMKPAPLPPRKWKTVAKHEGQVSTPSKAVLSNNSPEKTSAKQNALHFWKTKEDKPAPTSSSTSSTSSSSSSDPSSTSSSSNPSDPSANPATKQEVATLRAVIKPLRYNRKSLIVTSTVARKQKAVWMKMEKPQDQTPSSVAVSKQRFHKTTQPVPSLERSGDVNMCVGDEAYSVWNGLNQLDLLSMSPPPSPPVPGDLVPRLSVISPVECDADEDDEEMEENEDEEEGGTAVVVVEMEADGEESARSEQVKE